jgi:hypothetical protein
VSMPMSMVHVRIVSMSVRERFMAMLMRVRFVAVPGERVLMLMMGVVPMRVAVG